MALSVAAGSAHSLVLKDDGTVWATGRNNKGQLGLGDTIEENQFIQVPNITGATSIVAGYNSSMIITEDGTLYVAGSNESGQLGLANNDNQNTFVEVPLITGIEAISIGDECIIVLTTNESVWIAGSNGSGQLGLGNNTDSNSFNQVIGTLENPITNIKAISAGGYHTIILKEDDTVWATGFNNDGQLGLGNTTSQNEFTQVTVDGEGNNFNNIKTIVSGQLHSMILKNDGTIWASGINSNGMLGLGHYDNKNRFTQVDISGTKTIESGSAHTIILKNDGSVWTTGANQFGQLGLKDISNRTSFHKVSF